MLNVIGKGQEEEGSERCEQETEERVEEGLEEESGELEVEKRDINNKDVLESSQTNVQRTS